MNYILKTIYFFTLLCGIQQVFSQKNLIEMIETPDVACTTILTFQFPKSYTVLNQDFLTFLRETFGANLFIESGTYCGDTSIVASRCIEEVITIELSEDLYKEAKKRFSEIHNVTMYQGDTTHVLPQILKNSNKKIIFFLDGHFSSGTTAKGEFNTPILQELECIKQSTIVDSIILIDDIRHFQTPLHDTAGTAYCDYPEISVILNKIVEINPGYKCALLGDLLMFYIPVKNLSISPALYICTASRIWQPDMMPLDQICELEQTLSAVASHAEKECIKRLYELFIEEQNATFFGFNKYFSYWYSLLTSSPHLRCLTH